MPSSNKVLLMIASGIFILVVAFAAFMVFRDTLPEGEQNAGDGAGGITFLNIGPGTELTESVREKLEQKLGSDAVETMTTVNLKIHHSGFLETYFPILHDLNRRLNRNGGQRIEHDTIKLRYRYIPRQESPFSYVELMFSNRTKKPLYCLIRAEKQGDEIRQVLRGKYGEPEKIEWGGGRNFSLVWQKQGDFLIYSKTPDRYGNPGYQIMIYYVDNIKKMLAREERRRKEEEKQEEKAVDKAF